MKKFINEITEFGNDMNRHHAASYASSIAFFFFIAFFPSVMFIFSLIKYIPVTEGQIVTFVLDICPDPLDATVSSLLDELYGTSITMVPITALATLWTAGMGMMGLIRGLNGFLDMEDDRNYFVIRGLATTYTLLLYAVLFLSLIIMSWGRSIARWIVHYLPHLRELLIFFLKIRWFFAMLILILVFDLIYTFLPAKRQKMILQLPGAIVAAAGWIFISWAYAVYIESYNGLSLYGSLLTMIFTLFWFYWCFSLLIIGAFLNKYYNRSFMKGYDHFHNRQKNKEKLNHKVDNISK